MSIDNKCEYCGEEIPHTETKANSCLKKLSMLVRNALH